MDQGQLSMVADKFQGGFFESLLNAWGKDVKLCRHHHVSLGPGAAGDLCQRACRDDRCFPLQLQGPLWHHSHLQGLI